MFSRGRSLQSVRAQRRRRRNFKIKLAAAILLIILFFGGLVFLLHLKNIRIQKVYPEGNKFLSDEEVRASVRDHLSGSAFLLFPKDNIFFYPRSAIEKAFLSKYPEIKTINVSFRDFESITVKLVERQQKALWCQTLSQSELPPCYLIDENGLIFRPAGEYSLSTFIRFTGGVSGDPINVQMMPSDEFQTDLLFTDALRKENLSIISVSLKEGGVREGELSVGGKIIWNADQDLSVALENLKTLLSNPSFKGKDKNGTVAVQYIDIQNSNKIFYKVK